MTDYAYLYNSKRWRAIRRHHLAEQPLCVMCEEQGQITQATVCDHIIPHRGDIHLFVHGPFQSLCKVHHDSTKKIQETSGIMRGGSLDGQPIDVNHHWNQHG
jgi:5-methylcytosine-specific restriction protein A